MNLAEMKSGLRRYGFDDNDPLKVWINAALSEFVDEFSWPFLETITTTSLRSGENKFSELPSDFRKVLSLRNETNQCKLRYYNLHKFERVLLEPRESGTPEIYTLIGLETLRIWPIPTEEVEFRLLYIRSIPELENESDTPGIPDNYHYTIVRGAAYMALQAENEEDRANVAFQGWSADVERAKRFYSSHEEDEPNEVEEVQGYE